MNVFILLYSVLLKASRCNFYEKHNFYKTVTMLRQYSMESINLMINAFHQKRGQG